MKTKTDKFDTTKTAAPPDFFLGIDVGKADLFCHIIGLGQPRSQRFDNTPAGIKLLVKWLGKPAGRMRLGACLEQTGHYGHAIATALYGAGLHCLHVVNPHRIKAFGNQKLRRNKSDTADAKLIASFLKAEYADLHPWHPRSAEHQRVSELSRYADTITADNARLKTRLHSQSEKTITASLRKRISRHEKELQAIRKTIAGIIAATPALHAASELLKTIPGLGEASTQMVVAELPDIDQFSDARQLAAWVGVTPSHHQSGTSGRASTPITKIGSVQLRRGLYLPAMVARRYNPLLKAFADRLAANGKKPKQVILAVMRKLLHQIYGILKSGLPYNPEKRGYAGT